MLPQLSYHKGNSKAPPFDMRYSGVFSKWLEKSERQGYESLLGTPLL